MEGKLAGGDGMMSENLWERYGPYSKKKGKKRGGTKEKRFMKQGSAWLKWKVTDSGGSSFYRPCLEH
jgi:hypothetical protein